MKIIEKAIVTTKNNGTFDIQIEDWSNDYPDLFMPDSLLVAYPVAKVSSGSSYFAPKLGEKFRCEFYMPDRDRAMLAFNALINGTAELDDYLKYMHKSEYIPCVTGKEKTI